MTPAAPAPFALLVFRIAAATVGLLGLLPLANLLTAGAAIPWWRAAVWGWLIFGGLVVAFSVVVARTMGTHVDTAVRLGDTLLLRARPRAFAAGTAIVALILGAAVARYAFGGQPFTGDEMAQQWHARILLSGNLVGVSEPHPEFFNTAPVLERGGRWVSQYPVGGPALSALGLVAGAAWLVNPLLFALATWALARFLSRTADERRARIAVILFVTSPMVLLMAGSQMTHMPALTFVLFALVSLVGWDTADDGPARARHAAVVGVSLGLALLVRPLDGAIATGVVATFQLARAMRAPGRWPSLLVQAIAGAVPVGLLLWVNAETTGSPFLFAYDALNGTAHGLGFHLDPNGELHTPRRGLVFMSGYLMRLGRYFLAWPLPATLWIVIGLAVARRITRWDLLLVGVAGAVMLVHGAYWHDGFFAGPRFLFLGVPAFVSLIARAPLELAERLKVGLVRRTVLVLLPACVLWSWLGISGDATARGLMTTFHEQRTKLKTDVEAQRARQPLGHALVLVNESWRGRLLARLRTLGVTQFQAERALNEIDACALQTALDRVPAGEEVEDRGARILAEARALGRARPHPGLPSDRAVSLVPGTQPTPACLAEFMRDTLGTMPYSLFLARQHVGPDGRIGGPVIFARDLGARNELLRERFGDRTWYRYRPARALGDTAPVFEPYR